MDGHCPLSHTGGMTTTEKIAISLPIAVAQRVRRGVKRGLAPSVSAYVTRALEEQTKLDELSELLAEMLSETGGPLTKKERDAADRELGVSVKKPRARKQ